MGGPWTDGRFHCEIWQILVPKRSMQVYAVYVVPFGPRVASVAIVGVKPGVAWEVEVVDPLEMDALWEKLRLNQGSP